MANKMTFMLFFFDFLKIKLFQMKHKRHILFAERR